jgi:hypothetical protein
MIYGDFFRSFELRWKLKNLVLEEKVGFEPTVPFGTPDFESGTFGHSATSPILVVFDYISGQACFSR